MTIRVQTGIAAALVAAVLLAAWLIFPTGSSANPAAPAGSPGMAVPGSPDRDPARAPAAVAGSAPAAMTASAFAEARVDAPFAAAPARWLRLRVTDAGGLPAAGVPIEIWGAFDPWRWHRLHRTATDAEGRASLPHWNHAGAGTWDPDLTSGRYVPRELAAVVALPMIPRPVLPYDWSADPAEELRIGIPETAEVRLAFTDEAGSPVNLPVAVSSGVDAALTPGTASKIADVGNWTETVPAGADFTVRVERIRDPIPVAGPDPLPVWSSGPLVVWSPTGAFRETSLSAVFPGYRTVRLSLAGTALTGRIVRADGRPVAGVPLRPYLRMGPGGVDAVGFPLTTDPDGRFRVPIPLPGAPLTTDDAGLHALLAPGCALLGFWNPAPGSSPEAAASAVEASRLESGGDFGTLVMAPPPLAVSGCVTDEEGAPVASARVVIRTGTGAVASGSLSGPFAATASTGQDGRYEVRTWLLPGEEFLAVTRSGFTPSEPRRFQPGATDADIVLRRSRPVPDARFRLLLPPGIREDEVIVLASGSAVGVETPGSSAGSGDEPQGWRVTNLGNDRGWKIGRPRTGVLDLHLHLGGRFLEEPIAEGIVIPEASGSEAIDLGTFDLRGRLQAISLEARDANGVRLQAGFFIVGEPRTPTRSSVLADRHDTVIWTMARSLDVVAVAAGYRSRSFRAEPPAASVVLDPGVRVRLVFDGLAPYPTGWNEAEVSIWSQGEMDKESLFWVSGARENPRLRAPADAIELDREPGDYRVAIAYSRDGSPAVPIHGELLEIVVKDEPSTVQTFRLAVSREGIESALRLSAEIEKDRRGR